MNRFKKEGFVSKTAGPIGFSSGSTYNIPQISSLGYLPKPSAHQESGPQEQKEENMNTELSVKQSYLERRMYDVTSTKEMDLRKKFGLMDDEFPKDPFDLVKRIQDGKFVLPEKNETAVYWDCPLNYITFRDPAIKKDQEGFNEAYKDLRVKKTEIKDIIAIKTPEEALSAIQAFEAETV